MPPVAFFLGIYLLIISLTAVGLTVADKYKATHHRWRIPEATLFAVAALGGSAAMWLTMKWIRHKTRHRRFMWGLPLILLVQSAALVLLWYDSPALFA